MAKRGRITEFPARLRAAMKGASWTIDTLAARLGVTRHQVRSWTTGHSEPSLRWLGRMATECGTTCDFLVRGESPCLHPTFVRSRGGPVVCDDCGTPYIP